MENFGVLLATSFVSITILRTMLVNGKQYYITQCYVRRLEQAYVSLVLLLKGILER